MFKFYLIYYRAGLICEGAPAPGQKNSRWTHNISFVVNWRYWLDLKYFVHCPLHIVYPVTFYHSSDNKLHSLIISPETQNATIFHWAGIWPSFNIW